MRVCTEAPSRTREEAVRWLHCDGTFYFDSDWLEAEKSVVGLEVTPGTSGSILAGGAKAGSRHLYRFIERGGLRRGKGRDPKTNVTLPLRTGVEMNRYRVKCSECDCRAFSDPRDQPLSVVEVAELTDAIAHLSTCSKYLPLRVGQWKYCAPDSRPGSD